MHPAEEAPIIEWQDGTRLPPSLTRLQIDGALESVSLNQVRCVWHSAATRETVPLDCCSLPTCTSHRCRRWTPSTATQLSSLHRLQQLSVFDLETPNSGYACLQQLSQLTWLSLIACESLPDSLGQLTWLLHLEVRTGQRTMYVTTAEGPSLALSVPAPGARAQLLRNGRPHFVRAIST